MMTFGSTWQKVFKPLLPEIRAICGVELVPTLENNALEGLAKLQAAGPRCGVDLWFADQLAALRGERIHGLFQPISLKALSNLRDIDRTALTDHFIPFWSFPIGIVYRPDLAPGGRIDAWMDLFKPAFRDQVALPAPDLYPGCTILVAALLNGGSIDDVRPGLNFLRKVQDQVAMFHSADTIARRALARGDIWAMMGTPSVVKELADQGVPVAMVCPYPAPIFYEGLMRLDNGNAAASTRVIDYCLGRVCQQRMTDVYNLLPVNRLATISARLRSEQPAPQARVIFDEAKINAHLGAWTAAFDDEIQG